MQMSPNENHRVCGCIKGPLISFLADLENDPKDTHEYIKYRTMFTLHIPTCCSNSLTYWKWNIFLSVRNMSFGFLGFPLTFVNKL